MVSLLLSQFITTKLGHSLLLSFLLSARDEKLHLLLSDGSFFLAVAICVVQIHPEVSFVMKELLVSSFHSRAEEHWNFSLVAYYEQAQPRGFINKAVTQYTRAESYNLNPLMRAGNMWQQCASLSTDRDSYPSKHLFNSWSCINAFLKFLCHRKYKILHDLLRLF